MVDSSTFWYPLNVARFLCFFWPSRGFRHPDDELVGQAVVTTAAAKAVTGAQLSVTEPVNDLGIWG